MADNALTHGEEILLTIAVEVLAALQHWEHNPPDAPIEMAKMLWIHMVCLCAQSFQFC